MFNFAATAQDEEELSPEDAAMIKTLTMVQQEFLDKQESPLILSSESLKELGQIYCDSKFQGLCWTTDMCSELPIQCSDAPLYKTPTKESDAFEPEVDPTKPKGAIIDGKTIQEMVKEYFQHPYGAEKPITLCEAFIRKYLSTRKTQVCMQMRRSKEEAALILGEDFKAERTT